LESQSSPGRTRRERPWVSRPRRWGRLQAEGAVPGPLWRREPAV